MSISATNITRVSNNLQSMSLLDSLRRNTLNLFLEQSRMGTGNKYNTPSENPIAAAQAMNLTEVLERQQQILTNIQHAGGFLSATDDALNGVSNLLIQARSIASEMVNSTSDQAQRDASAELIKGILNEMVRIGNRMHGDVYLFGGQKTTTTPFTQDFGGVEYHGDTNDLLARVDSRQDTAINLTGSDLFGALSSEVKGFADLNPAIELNTRLADLKGAAGAGIERGFVRITLSSPATTFVVDLTQADDVGDVIDALNNAAAAAGLTVGAGQDFNATLNGALNGIQIAAGAGTVTVAENSAGKTARDLGLLGTAATITGSDLQRKVTGTTSIASLFGGAGAALGSIQITNGTLSATLDLSTATTIQDIVNAINTAGIEVNAKINNAGTGIDVVSRMSGAKMSIGEVGGGTTADRLGIRSLHDQTSLTRLNGGKGVRNLEGQADFRIVAKDGTTVDVELDGASTIQDVLDAINTAAGTAGVAISAGLATNGNGIRIVDTTGGAGTLSVQRLNLSYAIDDLGLNKSAGPLATELVGDDTNTIEPNSVFSVLMDLYESLKAGNTAGISDAGNRLGGFINSTIRVQGIVGARSQAMTQRLNLTEDAVLATQKLLSEVKDLDYTEAVTRFQQAQTTLQANLLTGSKLLQLSLMDFIR